MSGVTDVAVVQPPTTETIEAAGVTAVEIATIEAERDVTLATIAAETTETIAEAQAVEQEDDVEWLRAQLTGFETSLATLAGELSVLRQQQELQREEIARLTETVTLQAAALTMAIPPEIPPSSSETPLETPQDGDVAAPEAALEEPTSEATSESQTARPVRRRGWLR